MKIIYKGRIIKAYETFYRTDTGRFFRGCIGGGISRSCKCDDSLTILEMVYEDKDNRLCLEESAERSSL